MGSNIVLTADNQNVLARYEYDVLGAIHSGTGTSDNTRKFTGKEFDADSNLYYYAARYYDPYIGRFNQRDPAGDGVNWYAYTANNPLRYVDPTGELAILFDSYFNGPKVHIGWDEDIQRFYVKGNQKGVHITSPDGMKIDITPQIIFRLHHNSTRTQFR